MSPTLAADPVRFHRSRSRALFFVTPWALLLLKALVEGAADVGVVLAAVLLLVMAADGLLARRYPFLEIDAFEVALQPSAMSRRRTFSVAGLAWAVHSSQLILRPTSDSRVTAALVPLAKQERERLTSVLEERLGPPSEEVEREFARDLHRRMRFVIPIIAILLPLGILIALAVSSREPADGGRIEVPMAPRPPAEWPEPERVEPTPARVFEDSPYVGLWQFSTKMVWIDIAEDGSTFQCRVADDENWASYGTLYSDYRIHWERAVWGTDTIAAADEHNLVLDGPLGRYAFSRPARLPATGDAEPAAGPRERLRRLCPDAPGR